MPLIVAESDLDLNFLGQILPDDVTERLVRGLISPAMLDVAILGHGSIGTSSMIVRCLGRCLYLVLFPVQI